MRVKIKVGDNKVEFNMSKSQALLIVKMAQEFEKVYMQMCSQLWAMQVLKLVRTAKNN